MSKLRGYLLTCVCFSTDGYIACEEHEEVLRAAWVEEQELQKQKEKEVCFLLYHEFDNYWLQPCKITRLCSLGGNFNTKYQLLLSSRNLYVTGLIFFSFLATSRKKRRGPSPTGLCWSKDSWSEKGLKSVTTRRTRDWGALLMEVTPKGFPQMRRLLRVKVRELRRHPRL